jgi:hypothetical protein
MKIDYVPSEKPTVVNCLCNEIIAGTGSDKLKNTSVGAFDMSITLFLSKQYPKF